MSKQWIAVLDDEFIDGSATLLRSFTTQEDADIYALAYNKALQDSAKHDRSHEYKNVAIHEMDVVDVVPTVHTVYSTMSRVDLPALDFLIMVHIFDSADGPPSYANESNRRAMQAAVDNPGEVFACLSGSLSNGSDVHNWYCTDAEIMKKSKKEGRTASFID